MIAPKHSGKIKFAELLAEICANGEDSAMVKCVHNPGYICFRFRNVPYRIVQFFCDYRHCEKLPMNAMISIIACEILPNKTCVLFPNQFVLDRNNNCYRAKNCRNACGLFIKDVPYTTFCWECELESAQLDRHN
jgi:hypothetical protein